MTISSAVREGSGSSREQPPVFPSARERGGVSRGAFGLSRLTSAREQLCFFLQMSDSDNFSDDDEHFFKLVHDGAKLANIYSDLYLNKAKTRTSILTGMGWLNETLNTPGECHKILRMNTEIFLDLHDVLVERYGLQPSKHMNTSEMLGMFLWTVAGNESNMAVVKIDLVFASDRVVRLDCASKPGILVWPEDADTLMYKAVRSSKGCNIDSADRQKLKDCPRAMLSFFTPYARQEQVMSD